MKKLLLTIAFGVLSFAVQAQTYCTPSYSTGCTYGDDIDDVYIGNFSDTATGCTSSSYYNVQTSDTIFIQQTVPTSVSFTSNWSTQYFAIWVDFNDDGDFSDSGEHLWSSPTNAWSSTVGSITIPSTVSLGSYRLRVRSNYSGTIGASESCSNFTYGETHDYTVTVTTPPACPAPVLASLTATDTTATITWTSNDTVFNVDYNVMGSSAVPTTITVYDTTTTITGLSPNTWYEFYLETDCSGAGNGYSTTVGPYSVKTLCAALSTPIYEGFDNDSIGSFSNPNAPSCWYYVEESGAAGYAYINNATWSISPLSNSNYYYLYNSYDAAYEALVSPAVIGLDSGTKQMDIWLANTGWSVGNDVYVGTVSSPSSLTSLDIIDTLSVPNGGTWTKFTVYFDSSTGYNMSDDHIAIVSSNTSTYSAVYIEDILIKDAPPCLPPSAIGVGTVGMDSAQITYSTSGIATWLEYGPPGFTQGTGTQVQVTGSPAWLTGLTSNTTYDVYVLQMCSDSTISPGYGPVSFKTLACSLSQMCTFDIELTDTWGDGWNGAEVEILNSNGGVEYTLGANFTTGTSYTETISLCTGGSFTIVVSDDGSYPSEIGLNVISGGTTIDSYSATSATTVGTQMASFSANCNALCPTPSNLTYNAGKNDASFTFDKNGGTGTYEYQWGPTGFLQATGTGFTPGIDSTTSNNFTITGLASSSCYDVIIIQNCGANGVSDTLGPVAFCTGMCDTTDLCDFTMSMYDTWGDGWNGATVDLYFNGAYGQTFGPSFTTGDSLIIDFQICAGTEIAVVNGAQGSYPSEVYYTLSGSNGQSVSVSSGNFNAGPVDTLTANCVTPSCATPSNLGVANMGSTFADISWMGGNGTFIYHYTASGSTNAMMGTSTSAMASMTGLAPVTTYFFDVAEVCAPGDTSLKMHYTFTTDSCSAINVGNPNYSIDSIGTSFADITFTWGGASGYTSYFINFGDGSNATGAGSTHSHSYTANGQYTAVLKLYGDCDTTSQQIFVNIQGIGLEEQAAQSILMYPNPTTGLIHISGTAEQGEEVQMRVMNYVGQELFNTTITTTNGTFEKDFDLSGFSSGTYLVEIRTATGMVQRPFVVRH
ncbi:MAG: T9SS C-terminal target domain-containing protein [Flavobacteriia bacterium]|nr:T9SS C-terminal target domain-containing protein [Flavobacteriia bacterium]